MSEDAYNCLNCSDCDEGIQDSFNCDKNNIFKNLEIDTDNCINSIRYYKNKIYFSGCPLAFYIQNTQLMNFIDYELKFGFKNSDNFIKQSIIQTYDYDKNVQNYGELQEMRLKNGR